MKCQSVNQEIPLFICFHHTTKAIVRQQHDISPLGLLPPEIIHPTGNHLTDFQRVLKIIKLPFSQFRYVKTGPPVCHHHQIQIILHLRNRVIEIISRVINIPLQIRGQ